jgi:hypothetical protein
MLRDKITKISKINMSDNPDKIDLPALINNNPLTRLSRDYGSKIIEKIKSKFTDEDQQLFVANFYCYLNYNQKTDFVIILDRIWKWLGYSRIDHCKTVLFKNFIQDIDYKIEKAAPEDAEAGPKLSQEGKNIGGAGANREYTTLTVNCFKKLCLKSRTEKADQIHDYYVGLEDLMNELVAEQTEELQSQLQLKDKQNIELKEKTLIEAYKNKPIVYLAYVQNGIEGDIVKFGQTTDISDRITRHRAVFRNFKLIYCIESVYNRELEYLIKQNLKKYIITKTFSDTKQTELIKFTNTFDIVKLKKLIIEYKESLHSGEIMSKILEENDKLKEQLEQIRNTSSSEVVLQLTNENNKLKQYIDISKEKEVLNEQDQEDKGNCLYIWHNQVFKGIYKTGITDQDVSKDRQYIYTYSTDNANDIKQIMRILLKSSLHNNKESYEINYEDIKKIFDFCVMMYDTYLINKNTECVLDFIGRYNTHRLTVNSKTRETINKDIYDNFVSEKIIFDKNLRIPLSVLTEEFYEWYSEKYQKDNKNIKVNGNVSTIFRKGVK